MFWSSIKAVGIPDILDIALVSVLVYALLVWFKRAKAAVVAKGMLVVTGIYLFSRSAGMVMTTGIFHAFFAIVLVALVVIFQEELRSVFERIATFTLKGVAAPQAVGSKETEILVRTIGDLAGEQIGALVVLRGRDPLERHLEGGWALGGDVSEPLLKSIFDFHSIGHDGAVVIEGGRVTRFGAHLPLSKEFSKTAKLGTRHTAALGLAELADALCIVVSEERGTISVAEDGRIETLRGTTQLEKRIDQFLQDKRPQPQRDALQVFLEKNSREKALAIAASSLLWILFVLGAKDFRKGFEVPVVRTHIPGGMKVTRTEPETIELVFSGQMRDFYWVDGRDIGVRVDLARTRRGVNQVRLTDEDVIRPARLRLEEINPLSIEVEMEIDPAKREELRRRAMRR